MPELIPRPELMVIPLVLTDNPVGSNEKTLGLPGSSQWQKNVFDIVFYITFS